MATGIGANLIPNFENAVSPPLARMLETPAKIKFDCPVSEARYFVVSQDENFWGNAAYGIAAINKTAYDALLEKETCPNVYTTISAARMRADAMNTLHSHHTPDDDRDFAARANITVKPATNQSRKF